MMFIEKQQEIVEKFGSLGEKYHGRGNFELAPTAMQLRVTHNKWLEMNENERNRQFEKNLKFSSNEQENKQVISTDGTLTISVTAKVAKEPGQIKKV